MFVNNEYKYVIIPIIVICISQVIKFAIESIKSRRPRFSRLFNASGGMPSTHSAFVSSLATIVGMTKGFDSIYFAICLVFSFVVIYDAAGVRRETGKQAEAINDIIDEMIENKWELELKELKEQVGHNPIEVIFGITLGIILGIILII